MNQSREPNPDQGRKPPGQDVNQPRQQQQRQQNPDQGKGVNSQDQAQSNQRQDSCPATPDESDETIDRGRKNQRQGNEEAVDPAVDRTAQTSGEDVG